MPVILPIVFFLSCAWGEGLPLSGIQLNKKWHLREAGGGGRANSSAGFQSVFASDEFEVSIRGTRLASAALAKEKAVLDLANIQNLYRPRTNPYTGQVSDLVQCPRALLPRIDQLSASSFSATLLVGGANERKLLGACSRDQISYWGGYFQFFRESEKMAIEVRVFMRAKNPSQLRAAEAKIKAFSQTLFIEPGAAL